MEARAGIGWALKRSRESFNWTGAAGRAGMGLEPASGCESSKQASLPSNSARGVVGSLRPPLPFSVPSPLLYSPHHWPCFNKAAAIHIQPARKSRKLAAPSSPSKTAQMDVEKSERGMRGRVCLIVNLKDFSQVWKEVFYGSET